MNEVSTHKEGIKEYDIVIDGIRVNICLKRYYLSNELLVFFHGLGCSKDIFKDALSHHTMEGQSLLLIDFPGFGKSDKPESFSYKMEDQTMICEKLLAMFPDVRLHVIAHSMGGAVPILFSDKFYERIDSFANLEGNLIDADCTIFSRSVVEVSCEEYAAKHFSEQKAKLANIPELKFDETTPLAMYRSSQSLVEWSDSGKLLERFKKLNCKKVYIYGEQNKDVETVNAVGSIEKIIIPNAGHSMMLDNTDYFYNKLHDFIFANGK